MHVSNELVVFPHTSPVLRTSCPGPPRTRPAVRANQEALRSKVDHLGKPWAEDSSGLRTQIESILLINDNLRTKVTPSLSTSKLDQDSVSTTLSRDKTLTPQDTHMSQADATWLSNRLHLLERPGCSDNSIMHIFCVYLSIYVYSIYKSHRYDPWSEKFRSSPPNCFFLCMLWLNGAPSTVPERLSLTNSSLQ